MTSCSKRRKSWLSPNTSRSSKCVRITGNYYLIHYIPLSASVVCPTPHYHPSGYLQSSPPVSRTQFLMSLEISSRFPEHIFRLTVSCIISIVSVALIVTAQPDSGETRPNRETIGSDQVREPPAHGHGEAAASPRTQTSKSTRPVSDQPILL